MRFSTQWMQAALVLGLGVGIAAPQAQAEVSFLRLDFETGAHSLVDEGLAGQWSISPNSDWRFAGEFRHSVVPELVRDENYRGAFEIAMDGLHLGAIVFGNGMLATNAQITQFEAGAGLIYRFVPWIIADLSTDLRSERERSATLRANQEKAESEARAMRAGAPTLGLNVSYFSIISTPSIYASYSAVVLETVFNLRPNDTWSFTPRGAYYVYSQGFTGDSAAALKAVNSRSIRLVREGQFGQISGLWGPIDGYAQLYGTYRIDQWLVASLALTSAFFGSSGTEFVGYSAFVAFDRTIGVARHWVFTPAYEWVSENSESESFFSVRFTYRF